jgi:antagonist of mitotic exit network protein 1
VLQCSVLDSSSNSPPSSPISPCVPTFERFNEPVFEEDLVAQFNTLTVIEPQPSVTCHRALLIPEILTLILQYVDDHNIVPHEVAQKRRKPMSLRHALLIYGDSASARAAWNKAQNDSKKCAPEQTISGGLFSSMLVCRLWYTMGVEILYKKVHFRDQKSWQIFVNAPIADVHPHLLVLHKISEATQSEIDQLEHMGGRLRWLEFYTCPSIVPTQALLKGNKLTRIALPGCTMVNDKTMALIAERCPQLEHLDLRACDSISDRGLKAVAKRCPKLKLLNVGRTQRGELITYKGVKHIARCTEIDTLGLAGCHIDDRAMWELALHRGHRLQRLSLNNCLFLTNNSIPRILPYTKNLCVLELRGCLQVTEMRPIIQFKRYRELQGHPPLIEGCEVFELRMKEAEWLMEIETSRQVITDCLEWIYSPDTDVLYDENANNGNDNDDS